MLRLLAVAFVFALGVGLVGCSGKTAAPAPPAKAEFTVKAGDLLKEYSENAVAADAKYKGKVIQVSGKFGTAQKAPLLGYAVQVLPESGGGDLSFTTVQCFIAESAEADVAKLKQGDPVTMQGVCDGQAVGQVKLSKCTVVKEGKGGK